MGLDMYAFTLPSKPETDVDFVPCDEIELHYWRKHPDLHGWMERLYVEKGGAGQFNCDTVLLTAADIDRLEQDIRANRLPKTTGFFFGESDGTERQDDLQFIADARHVLAAGLAVFYTSWW